MNSLTAHLITLLPCSEDLIACRRDIEIVLEDEDCRMSDGERELGVRSEYLLMERN